MTEPANCPDCPDLADSPDRPEQLRATCCRDDYLAIRSKGGFPGGWPGLEVAREISAVLKEGKPADAQ